MPRGTRDKKISITPQDLIDKMLLNIGTIEVRKSKVSEISPFFGLKLRPDQLDVDCAQRAAKQAVAIFEKEGINIDRQELEMEFLFVSKRYWEAYEVDNRVHYSEMKGEVSQLERSLAQVLGHIRKLAPTSREALEYYAQSVFSKRSLRDFVSELESVAEIVHKACSPISSKKNTRIRRSSRFEQCGAELWSIRERITKRAISQTFLLNKNQFTTTDASFIYAVMRAIDDKVTPSNVQDGLQRAARAKKKRK